MLPSTTSSSSVFVSVLEYEPDPHLTRATCACPHHGSQPRGSKRANPPSQFTSLYYNTQLSQAHNNSVVKTSAIAIKMEQESIDSGELRSRFLQTLLSRRTARGLNRNPEFFVFDSCTNYVYFVQFFLFLFQFRCQLRLQNLWPTLCFRIILHALVRFRFFSLCFIYVF